jgi:hypothetical protein
MKILIIADANMPDRSDFAQAATMSRATNALIEVYIGDEDTTVPDDLRGCIHECEFRALRHESVLDVLKELTAPLCQAGAVVRIVYEQQAQLSQAALRHIASSRPDWLPYRGALLPLRAAKPRREASPDNRPAMEVL